MALAAVRAAGTTGGKRMNEELREEHFQQITSERARGMYDRLCDACGKRESGLEDADQYLIRDVCFCEQVKGTLMDDIVERGVGHERINGRQRYYAENKSLSQLRAYCESQRRLLNELRLTPAGRRAASVEIEDDFERFPD